MDPNIVPSNPLPPQSQIPNVSTQMNVPTLTDIPEIPSTHNYKKVLIISAVGIILISLVAGSYFIVPKIFTHQFAVNLKPQLTTVTNDTKSVQQEINTMYYSITNQQSPNSNNGVNSSGLLLHPNISSLLPDSNVLGISTQGKNGILEQDVLDIATELKSVSLLPHNFKAEKNVAGINLTAIDPITSTFMEVKGESQKTSSDINKSQDDLSSLLNKINSEPSIILTSNAKQEILHSSTLNNELKSYFAEAAKISSYYQNLASLMINMNTKIISFKTSIDSANTVLTKLNTPNLSADQIKSVLAQSQIYLNQAKQDTSDIEKMTSDFKNTPTDSLPASVNNYQQHNIKVLNTVETYFKSETTVLQSVVDDSNNLITKAQSGQATQADVLSYLNSLVNANNKLVIAETQFTSDIGTLVGEEDALTLSFWQDNGILAKGANINSDMGTLQHDLNNF